MKKSTTESNKKAKIIPAKIGANVSPKKTIIIIPAKITSNKTATSGLRNLSLTQLFNLLYIYYSPIN